MPTTTAGWTPRRYLIAAFGLAAVSMLIQANTLGGLSGGNSVASWLGGLSQGPVAGLILGGIKKIFSRRTSVARWVFWATVVTTGIYLGALLLIELSRR
ncbi:MAG TPA: hypothetical protein VFA43_24730 [Gemmatimonadaceae bacterium]|nr:hypothetical protein [Gemmatimonadaceae bacterium]